MTIQNDKLAELQEEQKILNELILGNGTKEEIEEQIAIIKEVKEEIAGIKVFEALEPLSKEQREIVFKYFGIE